jgi:hypothetical protein
MCEVWGVSCEALVLVLQRADQLACWLLGSTSPPVRAPQCGQLQQAAVVEGQGAERARCAPHPMPNA